ncbi:MAG: iron ABC transporter substrate-binding protein [Actinobacteria bacterium]|nr:iron ABC transporter substrate-binding protein [Actinomycetota bacterium]
MPKHVRAAFAALAVLVVAGGLAACNNDGGDKLVVYSGRNENLVRPILDRFAEDTGIDIQVRYGDTAELAATLLEEGENTRADVFFSQDAGALAALAAAGRLAALPADLTNLVDARFRDPDGRWLGVTGRARVIGYNTDRVPAAEVPDSVFALTDPKWRGRVGFPPTNASFIAFVSALTEQVGRERTKAWLEGLKANDAKRFDNNIVTLEAVADGEVDLGLVNHYYLYNHFKQRPGVPLANHYPGQQPGGEGTFVNVAGLGVLQNTDESEAARRLVEYLLGADAQEYFRTETAEYPMRNGIEPLPELPKLADLEVIDVPLHRLGRDLQATLDLLREVGLT